MRKQCDACNAGNLDSGVDSGAHAMRCNVGHCFGNRRRTGRAAWSSWLLGRVRWWFGQISEQTWPRAQVGMRGDPVRARGRHLAQVQRAVIVQRSFEERLADSVIAIDGLEMQAHLRNIDGLRAVGGGMLREAALKRLVLGGGLACEGQRLRPEGTYGIAVDADGGVVEGGG